MKHYKAKCLWLQAPQIYYIALNMAPSSFTSSELSEVSGTYINHISVLHHFSTVTHLYLDPNTHEHVTDKLELYMFWDYCNICSLAQKASGSAWRQVSKFQPSDLG